jgi:FKBP-type peptidyl-prolyl cis-trans isomerase FkpA
VNRVPARRRLAVLLPLSLMLIAVHCSRNPASEAARPVPAESGTRLKTSGDPEELVFAEELKVDLTRMTRTSSGLYLQDVLVGRGASADRGVRVRVGYIGYLADGTEFDRSAEGQPYTFPLGAGRVIRGWDEGIVGMKVGGRRLLVIPPALAYGSESPGAGIPPNATMVFDVRLFGIE